MATNSQLRCSILIQVQAANCRRSPPRGWLRKSGCCLRPLLALQPAVIFRHSLRGASAPSSAILASTRFRCHGHKGLLFLLRPKATDQQGQLQEDEVVDGKILPYCSRDKKTEKRTIGEMEQEFLQALQSFYYDKQAIMSNEEFDNLKEELMWEGSSVVMLSSDEQRFLEASMAYVSGNPVLSDKELDELKLRLKLLKVAIQRWIVDVLV
ncbi:hypothetical protein HPP92_014954 [Vanilla planifolia]|uniref:Uncharacterized protein n=1 Tax=Vanilla planifolia TaxID=51239 RepID=A0A835QSM0_VANPL|nr:hypothetical protein HPP92_014954 [Vanilla planifolia]